jgi:hypothetical protein
MRGRGRGRCGLRKPHWKKIGVGEKGVNDDARHFLKRSWRHGAVGGGSGLGAPHGGVEGGRYDALSGGGCGDSGPDVLARMRGGSTGLKGRSTRGPRPQCRV